jgi:phosphoserine phosphatase RsbU/P
MGPAQAAYLIVTNPSGTQSRLKLEPVPFRIGRLGENHLVLRDSRASRHHAQIVTVDDGYAIEDLKSSYGVFVNGIRIQQQRLKASDRIEFGIPESYRLTFTLDVEQPAPEARAKSTLLGGNLAKLRAMMEVARALQASLSTDEVLAAVVDGALAVTGCERGFLLLRQADDLETRVARDRNGPLPASELRVPTRLLHRALQQRKEFLSMNFDPSETGAGPEQTIAALELRSVVCLPLVRIRTGSVQETTTLSPADDSVGLLYMDSRMGTADLSAGGRELLTTLALEASTVLENARLLEQQWAQQRMEQELKIARRIQESLLPQRLPSTGWFRASASSLPSLQVGGDYVDVRQVDENSWAVVVADVSGKGVGAALLASLLQGIFLAAPYSRIPAEESMARVNQFLNDRTGGEQYATIFYCTLDSAGSLRWANAGHPPAIVAGPRGRIESLTANAMPVGLLEEATYQVSETSLAPGDKVILYTDGVTEARNGAGEFFGQRRLRQAICTHVATSCHDLHAAILAELDTFTQGAAQNDDVTLAVLEYLPCSSPI